MKPLTLIKTLAVLISLSSQNAFSDCTPGDGISCISTNTWHWTGSGDFFQSSNWKYGDLFGGPAANAQLSVSFGPFRKSVNGFPAGYEYGSSAEAVLSSDYTTTSTLTMRTGIDTSLTIRNATYALGSASIGIAPSSRPNDPLPNTGIATVNIDNGNISGHWNFYENSRLNILNGHFNPSSGAISGYVPHLNVSSGASFSINGTTEFTKLVENNGIIYVAGSATTGSGTFEYEGKTTLSGGGELVLADATYSAIRAGRGNLPNDQLINADHTIRGQGNIGGDVINQGVIRAEGGQLFIATSSFDNSAGRVEVAADGILYNGSYSGSFGDLAIEEGGKVSSGSRFKDLNLIGTGPLNVDAASTIEFTGDVNNAGRINVIGSSTTGGGTFEYEGGTRLIGGGEVVLTDATYSAIRAGNGNLPNDQLTNVDHTIRGRGNIGGNVVNEGVIRAEGGRLSIVTTSFDNSAGRVEVATGGSLYNGSYSHSFGDLAIERGGKIASGSRFKDLNLVGTGPMNINAGTVEFTGDINNAGRINVIGSSTTGGGTFEYEGPTRLIGGGEVVLTDATYSAIRGGSGNLPDDQLINTDHTIRGQGNISGNVVNNGTIQAEQGKLTVSGALGGQGNISVTGGSELEFNGSTLKQEKIAVDDGGIFDFNGSRLEVLEFTGDFDHDRGVYGPGASPAVSSLDGGYSMSGSAVLEIEIGGTDTGEFDQLFISGDADLLGGSLSVLMFGDFTLSKGQSFEVVLIESILSGTFLGLGEGALIGNFGEDLFITYQAGDGNDIALYTSPVPLPAAAWLFLSGLVGLVGVRKRGRGVKH